MSRIVSCIEKNQIFQVRRLILWFLGEEVWILFLGSSARRSGSYFLTNAHINVQLNQREDKNPGTRLGVKTLPVARKNAVRARRKLQLGSGIASCGKRAQNVNLRYASSGGRLLALSSYNPRELTTARHAVLLDARRGSPPLGHRRCS